MSYSIYISQIDPDSIGAAFGMKKYLGEGEIYYRGGVGHPQNRAIINRYNLLSEMTKVSGLEDVPCEKLVLVDSNDPGDEIPAIIVDHHRGSTVEATEIHKVEEVGSTCTLVVEMLQEQDIDERLAVLLALGIFTDTKSLMAGTKRDRDAYSIVGENVREISNFIHYPLPSSHFKNLTYALNHMDKDAEGKCIASAGFLPPEQGDDLATISDYLIRMDSVTLVIVWGIVGDTVRLSARSTDLSTPLDGFLKERFGDSAGAKLTPDGRGEGGARIELNLGLWSGDDNKSEILAMVSKRLRSLIE